MASLLAKKSVRLCLSPMIIMVQPRVFKSCGMSKRSEEEVKAVFEAWMMEHKRVYQSVEEKEERFAVFRESLRSVDVHNSFGDPAWRLGLDKFSDRYRFSRSVTYDGPDYDDDEEYLYFNDDDDDEEEEEIEIDQE